LDLPFSWLKGLSQDFPGPNQIPGSGHSSKSGTDNNDIRLSTSALRS
jgi:hypothetical protein